MSVTLTNTPNGRLYRLRCDQCGATHTPALATRTASDARHLARADGWRASSSKRKRPTHAQLCPMCRPPRPHGDPS